MNDRVWKLSVEKSNGSVFSIHGTEEILRAEFDAWTASETKHAERSEAVEASGQEYVEFDSIKPRVIHGISDSADRTDVLIAYRFADVIGMALVEI